MHTTRVTAMQTDDSVLESDGKQRPNDKQSDNQFDISDAVDLFKNILQNQLHTFSVQQADNVESLSKKLKEGHAQKLKSEGNRIRFEFNSAILEKLAKLEKRAFEFHDSQSVTIVDELKQKLEVRNKHIRIADSLPAGWKTVNEYQISDIADDEDDERKIRSAESRALRQKKQRGTGRPHPYANRFSAPAAAGSVAQLPPTYGNDGPSHQFQPLFQQPFRTRGPVVRRTPQSYDICFNCLQTGHWKNKCPYTSAGVAGGSAGSGAK